MLSLILFGASPDVWGAMESSDAPTRSIARAWFRALGTRRSRDYLLVNPLSSTALFRRLSSVARSRPLSSSPLPTSTAIVSPPQPQLARLFEVISTSSRSTSLACRKSTPSWPLATDRRLPRTWRTCALTSRAASSSTAARLRVGIWTVTAATRARTDPSSWTTQRP